jgi:hypothetical protein
MTTLLTLITGACGRNHEKKRSPDENATTQAFTSGGTPGQPTDQQPTNGTNNGYTNSNHNGVNSNSYSIVIVSPWSGSDQGYAAFAISNQYQLTQSALDQLVQQSTPLSTNVSFGCAAKQPQNVNVTFGQTANGDWGVTVDHGSNHSGYHNYGCVVVDGKQYNFRPAVIGLQNQQANAYGENQQQQQQQANTYSTQTRNGYQAGVNGAQRNYYIYQ